MTKGCEVCGLTYLQNITCALPQLHFKLCSQLRSMEGKIIVKNPGVTSQAWDHFGFYKIGNQVLKDKAVCKICFQECKYIGGTTDLNQHLMKHHSELIQGSGVTQGSRKASKPRLHL